MGGPAPSLHRESTDSLIIDCEGIYSHTGVNCYWIIDNSKEVLDRLRRINKTSQAKFFDS